MNPLVPRLIVAILVAAPAASMAGDIRTENPGSLGPFLDALFAEQMERHQVVGAAIAVVEGDRLLLSRGYGRPSLDAKRGVDPATTVFRIGSISKAVTAVAVLQQVDRGAIGLNDDVNGHLKQLQVPEAFGEPVRVRHLLTHTAGFDQPGLDRHVAGAGDEVPMARWLAKNLVRVRPPGQVTCYDTYGVTLAGLLVEEVSGLGYEEYLEKEIFGPLGMTRSGIHVREGGWDEVATGYEGEDPPRKARWEYMNTNPASTVNSTADDMARFMIMLLNDGAYRGRRVLSEELARAMKQRQFSNHPDLPGYTYLMFEDRDYGVEAVSHGGSMTGYAALMYLIPDRGLGIFIALNRESGAFIRGVMEPLMERITGGRPAPALRKPVPAPGLAAYAGVYASSMHNHTRPESGGWERHPFVLQSEDGRLIVEGRDLVPVGEDLFQRGDGRLVAFRRDQAGKISHMFIRQETYERLDLTVEDLWGPRLPAEELDRYAGTWLLEGAGIRIRIFGKDGYLWSQEEGEGPRRYRSLGSRRFEEGPVRVRFIEEEGRVDRFEAEVAGRKRTGRRVEE